MTDTIPKRRGRPPQQPVAPVKARKWEYTTLSAERPLTAAQFDVYGADGWELVNVYVRMDAVHAVFKREVI